MPTSQENYRYAAFPGEELVSLLFQFKISPAKTSVVSCTIVYLCFIFIYLLFLLIVYVFTLLFYEAPSLRSHSHQSCQEHCWEHSRVESISSHLPDAVWVDPLQESAPRLRECRHAHLQHRLGRQLRPVQLQVVHVRSPQKARCARTSHSAISRIFICLLMVYVFYFIVYDFYSRFIFNYIYWLFTYSLCFYFLVYDF